MDLERLLELLSKAYDVHDWWPSRSTFEVMVGAILTQQTNWESVAKIMDRLRSEGLLEVDRMAECGLPRLESIIRPAGFYRQKARRVKLLAEYLKERHGSEPMKLLNGPTDAVRNELLSLEGIGKETADSILVFGARRAKFVAAAYTARILGRTGVFRSKDYDEIQSFVETNLKGGPETFRDLYALMVQLSKDVCRPIPCCERCYLRSECKYPTGPGRR